MNAFKINGFRSILEFFAALAMIMMVSCNSSGPPQGAETTDKQLEDSVAAYNQEIVGTESQEIEDYILRYQWQMKKTETGLRYMIYKQGDGRPVKPGDQVSIRYKINLLTGESVLRSDSVAFITLLVGKRQIVSGLEEGILLMNQGSKAKLIVPSHLGYGLLGDNTSIPARASIIFDVEVCRVDQSKK